MSNFVGAHVKRGKTIVETIDSVMSCGGNALQLFVSSPISAKLVDVNMFKSLGLLGHCEEKSFKLVIHAPYIINLAMEPKNNKRLIDIGDCYWIRTLVNQLMVAHTIGAIGVVVHVGKYTKNRPEDALEFMREAVRYVISIMKELKLSCRLLIETPAGAGTELLCDTMSFLDFYNSFTDEEKECLGICLDTAHVWSSGYDINDYYRQFGDNVKDIDVIHLNNSKKKKGSKADAHDTVMCGNIPVEDIAEFVKNLHEDTVVILETPSADLSQDIAFVRHSLCKEQMTSCGTV